MIRIAFFVYSFYYLYKLRLQLEKQSTNAQHTVILNAGQSGNLNISTINKHCNGLIGLCSKTRTVHITNR